MPDVEAQAIRTTMEALWTQEARMRLGRPAVCPPWPPAPGFRSGRAAVAPGWMISFSVSEPSQSVMSPSSMEPM